MAVRDAMKHLGRRMILKITGDIPDPERSFGVARMAMRQSLGIPLHTMMPPPFIAFTLRLRDSGLWLRVPNHDDPISCLHILRVHLQALAEALNRELEPPLILCHAPEGIVGERLDERAMPQQLMDDRLAAIPIAGIVEPLGFDDEAHQIRGELRWPRPGRPRG